MNKLTLLIAIILLASVVSCTEQARQSNICATTLKSATNDPKTTKQQFQLRLLVKYPSAVILPDGKLLLYSTVEFYTNGDNVTIEPQAEEAFHISSDDLKLEEQPGGFLTNIDIGLHGDTSYIIPHNKSFSNSNGSRDLVNNLSVDVRLTPGVSRNYVVTTPWISASRKVSFEISYSYGGVTSERLRFMLDVLDLRPHA